MEQVMHTQGDSTEQSSHAFSAVVESEQNGLVIVTIPGKSYQLHLAAPANATNLQPGQHIRGTVQGESLRMYPAHAGGKFIEPVWGSPRIVAGVVIEADPTTRTVIVDAVAIFKLRVPKEQNFAILIPGALVNFYIKSGATFEPTE